MSASTDSHPPTPAPSCQPQRVPVVAVDTHLPAIDAQHLHKGRLRGAFGWSSGWQAESMVERRWVHGEPRAASVLMAIVMRPQPCLLLTHRAGHLSQHAGQIALPGGRADETDPGPVFTALRETAEEVGIPARQLEVLGALPPYSTGSAYTITPVVALWDGRGPLAAAPGEVESVFEVPLAFLMNPAHHRWHEVEWQGAQRRWLSMPYHDGAREHFIWGATAGMIRQLYRRLSAAIMPA